MWSHILSVSTYRWESGEPDSGFQGQREPNPRSVPDGEDCQDDLVQPTFSGSTHCQQDPQQPWAVWRMVRSISQRFNISILAPAIIIFYLIIQLILITYLPRRCMHMDACYQMCMLAWFWNFSHVLLLLEVHSLCQLTFTLISCLMSFFKYPHLSPSRLPTLGRVMWRPWQTEFCWWGISWRPSCKLWAPRGPGTTSLSRLACSASPA